MKLIGLNGCIDCAQKDDEINQMRSEMQCMKAQIDKLKSENEALVMDVAFYGGNLTNLSCNDK